jgi:uncharacterized protein YggT (Ycf19 family)
VRAVFARGVAYGQVQTMILFQLLIASIVHLALVGLDVLSFFVVVRILAQRWSRRPLLAFDQVGKPITDPLLAAVGRAIPCNWTGHPERRKHYVAAATLLVLALCRLGLTGLLAA